MSVWSAFEAPVGEVEPPRVVLSEAVESELAVDVAELSDAQLGERCLRLRAERDRLKVAIARADAHFEASRAFCRLDPGCTKAWKWLAARTRTPAREARRAYRHAARLMLLPLVQAAVVAGTVSMWHAAQLTRAAVNPGRARQLRQDQQQLLDAARAGSARDFVTAVRHWSEDHFPEEAEADAVAQEQHRHVDITQTEAGPAKVTATLHTVWGKAFTTCLRRIETELFRADWAQAKNVHGDHTRLEHLVRTPAQRRHDALVEMAFRAEASRPNAAARRPLVSVLVDWPTAHRRICELEDGTHLTPDQALRALRVADVERAVWGPDDRIRISEKTRLFRGAERRAVELRDRFCTTDGCDIPADCCECDHVDPAANGGPTDQANARMKCVGDHPNRHAHPTDQPLPWEHAEDDWELIDTQRAQVLETASA